MVHTHKVKPHRRDQRWGCEYEPDELSTQPGEGQHGGVDILVLEVATDMNMSALDSVRPEGRMGSETES